MADGVNVGGIASLTGDLLIYNVCSNCKLMPCKTIHIIACISSNRIFNRFRSKH